MINIKKLVFICCALSLLNACGDEHDFNKYDEAVDQTAAKMKFVHAAVGPAGVNFSVNYSVKDTKISGVNILAGLPLGIGYGGLFPNSLNYAFVASGAQTIKVVIPARAAVPAIGTSPAIVAFPETPVFTGPVTTASGKEYTTFLVGTSPNYLLHTINDDFSFVNPNSTTAFVRFVNLVTNTPVAGYELVFIRNNPATPTTPGMPPTTLRTFSGIGYLGGSAVFEPLPTILNTESAPYIVQLRITGTSTIVTTFPAAPAGASFIPRPGRTYTFFVRGIVGGLPTVTQNIPVLTFYTNR